VSDSPESSRTSATQPSTQPSTPDHVDPPPVESETDVDRPAESPVLQALADAVQTLREALEASHHVQEHQRALLDKLHAEKQELREAEQRRLRDPVLRDLIQLSDTCVRNSRQWQQRSDIRLTLERQGVERCAPVVDDKFDRSEAKAVGSVPTADPTQDGLVAEVRKSGYRLDDRVVRYSEVVVWRHQLEGGQESSAQRRE
jgi:molecular chaperone GrpE (heat shock protein)